VSVLDDFDERCDVLDEAVLQPLFQSTKNLTLISTRDPSLGHPRQEDHLSW
jgi:hypothetical protein